MSRFRRLAGLVAALMCAGPRVHAQQARQPVADDLYLQEVGSRIATSQPVTAVGENAGTLFCVVGSDLMELRGDTLR